MRMAKLRLPGFARETALLFDGGGAGAVDWSVDLTGEEEFVVVCVGAGSGVCGAGTIRGICGS